MDNGDGLISDQSAEGVKWDVSGLPLGPSSVASVTPSDSASPFLRVLRFFAANPPSSVLSFPS
jgi:hypothetical protein